MWRGPPRDLLPEPGEGRWVDARRRRAHGHRTVRTHTSPPPPGHRRRAGPAQLPRSAPPPFTRTRPARTRPQRPAAGTPATTTPATRPQPLARRTPQRPRVHRQRPPARTSQYAELHGMTRFFRRLQGFLAGARRARFLQRGLAPSGLSAFPVTLDTYAYWGDGC